LCQCWRRFAKPAVGNGCALPWLSGKQPQIHPEA